MSGFYLNADQVADAKTRSAAEFQLSSLPNSSPLLKTNCDEFSGFPDGKGHRDDWFPTGTNQRATRSLNDNPAHKKTVEMQKQIDGFNSLCSSGRNRANTLRKEIALWSRTTKTQD